MYFEQELINEIIKKNPIVEIIKEYTTLNYVGRLMFGICPFHKENAPSLAVDLTTQTFFCFGCGAGGNVIDFVMKKNNISFCDAVSILAQKANIVLPEPNLSSRNYDEKVKTLLRINSVANEFYKSARQRMTDYHTSGPGTKYLRDRGLRLNTMERFELGYAAEFGKELYCELRKAGFSNDDILDSGLVGFGKSVNSDTEDYYDKFWNRIIFPIFNVNNQCIGFGGRCLGDSKPKYLNSPETSVFSKRENLYGLNIAKNFAQKGIILAEGYMDVIALHQAGFNNTVASLGTALTASQAALLKIYTNKVFIAYDSDVAGINAAMRAIPILSSVGIETKIVKMPGAKDPDEFIKSFGVKSFREQLDSAESYTRFLVRNSSSPISQAIDILLTL